MEVFERMKLGNKGMTMVEIIVSISLVAIVMIFTLNLLTDLKSEETLGMGKTADLLNRSIIAKNVQADFAKGVSEVGYLRAGAATRSGCYSELKKIGNYTINSCFSFKVNDGRYYYLIAATKGSDDYFIYANASSSTSLSGAVYEAWKLTSANYKCLNYKATTVSNSAEKYFRVYLESDVAEYNSNTVMNFDLEFSYYYFGDDIPGFNNLAIDCRNG